MPVVPEGRTKAMDDKARAEREGRATQQLDPAMARAVAAKPSLTAGEDSGALESTMSEEERRAREAAQLAKVAAKTPTPQPDPKDQPAHDTRQTMQSRDPAQAQKAAGEHANEMGHSSPLPAKPFDDKHRTDKR